jgi:DNA-binding beta-propeller fold protein YncE
MRSLYSVVLILLFSIAVNCEEAKSKTVALPEGSAGIGFDDIQYSSAMKKVLVPSGRTGILNLVDPQTLAVTSIGGFSSVKDYTGGHGEGITSVAEAQGVLFVTDRSSLKLNVLDPASRKIISTAPLGSSPDYVRFIPALNEVWVTEPDADQIEVFKMNEKHPAHSAFIKVEGGPEALVIDAKQGRAYSHLWHGKTVAIDINEKKIVATWTNGCEGSRGISFGVTSNVLLVGCSEGKAVSMDVAHDGKIISSVTSGNGVDIIAYNHHLKHLYMPGGKSATMAIISVSDNGNLKLLQTVPAAEGSHCVTTDQNESAFVCDPKHGSLLVIKDNQQ